MYATVERSTHVEEPADDEFNLQGTTYLPTMNIGFEIGITQQETMVGVGSQSHNTSNYDTQYDGMASMSYHNFDYSVQICDIEGLSNAPTQLHIPALMESTDRQIVSNNDVANNQLDSDSPFDHDGTDDEQSSGDDGHSYEDVTSRGDGNVSYHSNAIPYLDNTEEGPNDFAFTRDDSPVRPTLWDRKKPDFIKLG
ncbi:hypothetical protein K7X08_030271 [Anisodus acutangulus]|uniref:Uncharacterized protein n=1 Tax=Anisodus acutangulus TaxID=402998 RepID=A0A9Q1R4G4_9SOLA|nr:hypothetical protein K7X08_030271 [Anisodus acutangulus]